MKKIYFAKVLTALLFSALACMAVQAETMDNYPIDKSPYYGLSPLAASTFSIEDASSTTQLTTFPLSDVVVYPEAASITMDEAYTEKQSGFGNGGTTSNPYYAVTNVASNITSSFNFGDGRQNYLFFHAPAKEKTALSISAEHKAKTGVNIRTIITLVKGNKTKLELWAGPAGKTSKITDYEFDRNKQKVEFKIDEYSFDLTAVTEGAEVVYEIRRGNYYEGDDCVFALSTFYVHGTPDVLKLTASQLVAPLGTPVKLSAIYSEPVTQQRLHWFQGESIGGFPYYPELIQFTGQNPIELMPSIGSSYYTVTALGQDDTQIASADTVEVIRYLECGENSKVVWHEDFGTLASEDARNSYADVKYTYASTGNVNDGKYAITANPRTCGQDNTPVREEADYWFRSTYDHTQGGAKDGVYGGMLLINCRDGQPVGDVVLEKTFTADELGCPNSKIWLNFSAWFANADWNRGRGETHNIDMLLRVKDATGAVLGSIDVVASVNEGWKRGIVSIPYAGSDLTLQIVNYGQAGGGNDVLIDDIQFEICRPAVGIVAETLDGKKFDDIKNVRTQKCGDNVTLIADPEKNFMDIFPIPQGCAYFMWLQSEDGETWDQLKVDDQPWAGYGNCDGLSIDYAKAGVATIENKPMYYKALIGLSEREVGLYWRDPESEPCASVVETPAAYVYCSSLKLTIEKEKCNEYEAEVENPESGHTFKWEYGNENCGWTVIEGQTSAELKFDAKAYFDLLNKEKSAASADCCELGIRVTDNTSGDMAIGYVNTVYVTSLVAELLSQEDCMSKYRLTAEIKDACYGEPMGELYEFYKDGQKIDRCEDNNDGNGDDTYQRPARGASRTVVIDNNPNISINRSVTGYDDSAEPSDCDWDPEYITEGLINGATYTVKFGGDDDMMYCEATVNITAGCDIMWPTIITPYAKDNLNDLFIPFYCADKSNDGKCNRSINFPEENIVSIKVFDRSGNMVAETTKAGWSGVSGDGTNFVMPGVYYYVAVCTVDGQDQTYRGTIEVFNELKTEKK